MKIRSKALYGYLIRANVATDTLEAITRAKQEYRRIYKQRWKQQHLSLKEIRFSVTVKQLGIIKAKAEQMAIGHTTYARNIILTSINEPMTPPDELLAVLQAVSMAAIAIEQGKPGQAVHELVRKAELTLLQYLTK